MWEDSTHHLNSTERPFAQYARLEQVEIMHASTNFTLTCYINVCKTCGPSHDCFFGQHQTSDWILPFFTQLDIWRGETLVQIKRGPNMSYCSWNAPGHGRVAIVQLQSLNTPKENYILGSKEDFLFYFVKRKAGKQPPLGICSVIFTTLSIKSPLWS